MKQTNLAVSKLRPFENNPGKMSKSKGDPHGCGLP